MTDKATIQPKSKPEKTTISISGETSERLEIYCRANGILRKEFVSLRWIISSVPDLTCKVTLSIIPHWRKSSEN